MKKNCIKWELSLTAYQAGDLDSRASARVKKHLDACPDCRAELEEIRAAYDLLQNTLAADAAEPLTLSADRHTRILNAARARAAYVPTFADRVARILDFGLSGTTTRYAFMRAFVPVAITLLIVCGLAGMLLPSLSRARPYSRPQGSGMPVEFAARESSDGVQTIRVKKMRKSSRADLEAMDDLAYDAEPAEESRRELEKLEDLPVNSPALENWESGKLGAAAEKPGWHEAAAKTDRSGGSDLSDLSDRSDGSEVTVAQPTEPALLEKSPIIIKNLFGDRLSSRSRAGAGGGKASEAVEGESTYHRATDTDGNSDDYTVALDEVAGPPAPSTPAPVVAPQPPPPPAKAFDAKFKHLMKEIPAPMLGGEVTMGFGSGKMNEAGTLGRSVNGPEDDKRVADAPKPSATGQTEIRASEEVNDRSRNVDNLVREGRGFLATGDYKAAEERFKSALTLDPEKKDAMQFLERTGERRFASSSAEFKATAENMIADVRDTWNPRDYQSPALQKTPDSSLGKEAAPKAPVEKRKEADKNEAAQVAAEPAAESTFAAAGFNPYVETVKQPFSTFSIDVDTAAYTLTRKHLLDGKLPPPEAVRTEEIVNFFDYHYSPPAGDTLFAVHSLSAPSPFRPGQQLLRIGVKARRLGREENRRAVLTFAVDTSGSMSSPERLGLVRQALRLLVEKLSPDDLVALIQFDTHARLVLDYTRAAQKEKILKAIDGLQTSGSTNLEEGMRLAYESARRAFKPGAGNRVLLLSDGAANLGEATAEQILSVVADSRRQGIFCSVYGVGRGGFNDVMLETLANKGDGSYVYLDTLDEARRVFVDELAATLNTVAADVKIQVEFNTGRVSQYRQLGYENRRLRKEQFRDNTVDAGEVGSGQSVTALYDLSLAPNSKGPLGVVRIRFRDLRTGRTEEIEAPLPDTILAARFEETDPSFQLAACAAEFAEHLRGSPYTAGSDLQDVAARLRPVAVQYAIDARVQELLRLVTSAASLKRGAE